MPEDKEKKVETTTEQDGTAEKKEPAADEGQGQEAEQTIDYDKELEAEVAKFEQKEQNREGYQKRKTQKKDGEESEPEPTDIQSQVEAALEKALPKFVPKLQSTLVEDTIETLLNEFSGGNEAKKRLLRWNFENRITAVGTMRERMENAVLITDKKAILKKQGEMATALKNRQGLGASGLGGSSEDKQPVGDNILSTDQLKDLKAKGWDDKKIERFKVNLRR
ncbi:MAG: hypothetical protein ACREGC_00040 [Minisyncoccia bacterium]